MLITSSVVELKEDCFLQAESYLKGISGVEIRGVSKDMSKVLLIIETEDSDALEKICNEINEHPAVVTVLHHSFHFDDDE